MENLEIWHLVVAMSSLFIGTGMAIFGSGFRAWSDRLDQMSARIEGRLKHIEEKMVDFEHRFHQLHVDIESRVSWIEAKIANRRLRSGNPTED